MYIFMCKVKITTLLPVNKTPAITNEKHLRVGAGTLYTLTVEVMTSGGS